MSSNYMIAAVFLLCSFARSQSEDPLSKFTVKPSKYSVVNPQLIHRWKRNLNPKSEKHGEESMSFSLNINDRKHLIHLQKNRDFLHPNFAQYSHNSTGNHKASSHKSHRHCYYHGEVEGHEASMVALSTCAGLRGVIVLGNETYVLEPVPQSATHDHLLYRLRDAQSPSLACGVDDDDEAGPSARGREPFNPGQSMTSLLRRKRNLPQTRYVELALVVDNLRYNFKKKNETAVREEVVELANLLDGYYKMLNIRVMLVGLVIFKDRNPFSIEGTAGDVLGRFVAWRKASLLPTMRHDIGQLIVGRPGSYGGVLGMAFVGTVCSASTSGGINVYSDDSLPYFSTVLAHEMGHNLGMNHDDERCKAQGSFIMGSSASGSTSFSRCSADDFEALVMRGGGTCLKNQPSASDVIGVAVCGNSRLEEGEECDCGKPEECNNRCCDAATCKLTSGSACAYGECCDNCQFKVAGTPCRKSVNTCDLPEYCNGATGLCPDDFYVMDGLPCADAYCYDGRCQTYDFQCRHLFAPDQATKADNICFQYANTRGTLFGNCGMSGGRPVKCSVENAMCGKVQCTNVDLSTIPPGAHVSIQIVQGFTCINADFNLGTDVLDPAYVNPGSPCDKGKTCIDFQCVNASALLPNLNCDAQSTCHGHGVCNNDGHCHCENGWSPPNCDQSGRGGSIDSGPAQIDYSLRNGLLIFFLLVVPIVVLVVLVLLYIFRRDSLDPCLKGSLVNRFKSHNAQTSQPSGQSNHSDWDTTVQTPPALPETSPATSLPISGFRYGELDYWNADKSTVTENPGPTQGPGVPKPIPSRPPQN